MRFFHNLVALGLGNIFAINILSAVEWEKHTIVTDTKGGIPSAVACDVDNDGKCDVIAGYDGKVVLFRNSKSNNGAWESHIIHTFEKNINERQLRPANIHSGLVDVDGDGDLDYIGSNQVVYWLECPANPFDEPWTFRLINSDLLGAHCITIADIDGDKRLDLVANSFSAINTKYPNSMLWFSIPPDAKSRASWEPHIFADQDAPGGNHYIGVGDLNNDGRVDMSVGAKGGEGFPGGPWFAWWEQPADPKLAWKKHVLTEARPGATHAYPCDVDGDGIMDIIASCGHAAGVLWFKGPTFGMHDIDPAVAFPHALTVADLDGDGDIDAAVCGSKSDGHVKWYQNNGKGQFTIHTIDTNQGSYDIRAVDMDGDGDLDLLNAGQSSKNIVWYENK